MNCNTRFAARVRESQATIRAVFEEGRRANPNFTLHQARLVVHSWDYDYQHVICDYHHDALNGYWLNEQCAGDFVIMPYLEDAVEHIRFELKTDAMLFCIRFGGRFLPAPVTAK